MKFTNILTVMKIPKLLLPLGFALFASSIVAHAQTEDLDYSSGSQGEDGALSFPTPLNIQIREAAVAGDTTRNEVVVFGGYDSSWNLSSATWVWTNPNKSPYQLELRVCPKNPAANQFPDVFHASLATRHRQKPIFPIRQGVGGRF